MKTILAVPAAGLWLVSGAFAPPAGAAQKKVVT